MGSVIQLLTVEACSSPRPDQRLPEIQRRVDAMEKSMSLYQSDSQISTLNRQGSLRGLHKDFLAVLQLARAGYVATEGAFNVGVEPALRLIRASLRSKKRPPSDAELERLRPLLNLDRLKIQDDEGRFLTPGMAITLDGIAKGYAVDQIAQDLVAEGVQGFLINFSGNMRAQGAHADGAPWKVALSYPDGQPARVVELRNQSVASSGKEHVYFTDDRAWHHIIDPQTLHPSQHWARTTVIGPSAATCDLLSTATFALSAARLEEVMARAFPAYAYWAVSPDGTLHTNLP